MNVENNLKSADLFQSKIDQIDTQQDNNDQPENDMYKFKSSNSIGTGSSSWDVDGLSDENGSMSDSSGSSHNKLVRTKQDKIILHKKQAMAPLRDPIESMNTCKEVWRNADAVCFDVDSTVCVDEAIDELAKFVGKSKEVSDITRKAMQGGANFRQALAQRLDIIKPNKDILSQFMRAHPPKLTDDVKELVDILHELGRDVYLVSGGFDVIIQPAAKILNIPYQNIYANSIKFYYDGSYAGFDKSRPTSDQDGKPRVISMLKRTKGYNKVVMIGDGMTDLEACPPADAFIGFGGNQVRDAVRDNCDWFVYNFKELITELPSKRSYCISNSRGTRRHNLASNT